MTNEEREAIIAWNTANRRFQGLVLNSAPEDLGLDELEILLRRTPGVRKVLRTAIRATILEFLASPGPPTE